MLLHLLVPSLLRVNVPPSTVHQHPLHTLLIPLLLTPRAATRKYHIELRGILIQGGRAGKIEEAQTGCILKLAKVHAQKKMHKKKICVRGDQLVFLLS